MVHEILLFSIPEAVVVAWIAIVLCAAKVKWKIIFLAGTVTGIISGVARYIMQIYPEKSNFTVSMLVYAFVLTLILWILKVAPAWKLVVSVAFAMPIYLLTEFICMLFVQELLLVSPADFLGSITLKFLCFLPQLVSTALIALLFIKYDINLFISENDSKEVL